MDEIIYGTLKVHYDFVLEVWFSIYIIGDVIVVIK